MVDKILTPMNHREIEYNAKKLSGRGIPGSFFAGEKEEKLLQWLEETGRRVFDEDLVMDYGTDCLRLYLMFEHTPKENDAPLYESWQEGALEGIYKFLGRYRRMILVSGEWNRRGNYNEETFSEENCIKISHAWENTFDKINRCLSRGNTLPDRHNIVSALMELLNVYQKELKIGKIVTLLHEHRIASAVPHGGTGDELCANPSAVQNHGVAALCRKYIVLMAPYAPDLSKVLWDSIITVTKNEKN